MKKRYWPLVMVGLFLLSLLWPAPEELLDGISFSSFIKDRSGEPLRLFLSEDDKYRVWFDLTKYPEELIEALILKEDRFFYSHHGVDLSGVLRAGYETYIKKSRRVGASTLTMQVVRLKDGLYTRNLIGKLKQIYRAIYLDLHYSKQEILEAYLNLAPCGGNIEGFGTASLFYFNCSPKDLSLSEILFLVVLPQNPEVRSPKNGEVPRVTIKAREVLFNSWIHIHPEDKQLSLSIDMPISIEKSLPFIAPHATEYIKENYSETNENYTTSIDVNYQKIVKRQLNEYITEHRSLGVNNGAVLLLEYESGEIISSVGSNDYFDNEIEGQVKGFSAKRSPGSTLKPFIYALALEQGLIHPFSMLKDSPTSFGVYTPDNYKSNFKGPIFAWQALVESRNIPAINLANSLRDPDLYEFLKNCNVSNLKERDYYGLSIVLGSAEVNMLELGAMYAAIANGGYYKPLTFLKGDSTAEKIRVLTPESSFLTLEMLNKNPAPIKYRPKESKDIPIGYKTGTSIGFKDSWSVGIFDDYVIIVWIGNFDGGGNPAFIGRTMAAPLLFSIADNIILEKQATPKISKALTTLKKIEVCSVSGGIPTKYCTSRVTTGFIPGISPITKCHIHREVYIDKNTGYRTDNIDGDNVDKQVREFWPSDLLELFEQAGLPRLKPPSYPPDSETPFFNTGYAPTINSPLDSGEYIIRTDSNNHNSIILIGNSDGDSNKLFWFANNEYLGSGEPESQLEWFPQEGNYQITVVDDKGRSSSSNIVVTLLKH